MRSGTFDSNPLNVHTCSRQEKGSTGVVAAYELCYYGYSYTGRTRSLNTAELANINANTTNPRHGPILEQTMTAFIRDSDRTNSPVRKPDGTLLANTWNDFLNPQKDILVPIANTGVEWWTGLDDDDSRTRFSPASNCGGVARGPWSSAEVTANGSWAAGQTTLGPGRLGSTGTFPCNNGRRILCATYSSPTPYTLTGCQPGLRGVNSDLFSSGAGGAGVPPHAPLADPASNRIRYRFNDSPAEETTMDPASIELIVLDTGVRGMNVVSPEIVIPARGSDPDVPVALQIDNIRVASTERVCVAGADPLFRLDGGPGFPFTYFPGGTLTATDTARSNGCNIEITQSGYWTGHTVKGEIQNCALVFNTGYILSRAIFSAKFNITLPVPNDLNLRSAPTPIPPLPPSPPPSSTACDPSVASPGQALENMTFNQDPVRDLNPHSSPGNPAPNRLRGRFGHAAMETETDSDPSFVAGTADNLYAAFPLLPPGSAPPFNAAWNLVFWGLNVTSVGTQCTYTYAGYVMRLEYPFTDSPGVLRTRINPGGVLTAANTATTSGCNIEITQAGSSPGDVVKGEILNCVFVGGAGDEIAVQVFSGRFEITLP